MLRWLARCFLAATQRAAWLLFFVSLPSCAPAAAPPPPPAVVMLPATPPPPASSSPPASASLAPTVAPMASASAYRTKSYARNVTLAPFWLDVTEVTAGAYRACPGIVAAGIGGSMRPDSHVVGIGFRCAAHGPATSL